MKERGRIFVWTLFDFANTSFSVIIVTVVFSKYFSNHVAGGQNWIWGLAVSTSMVIAALLSPPLGAIADVSRNRKRFLLMFTLLSVICTLLMFFVQEGDILLGFVLFILANIGFEGGLVFYNGFLPQISTSQNIGKISGYGFAFGYVGALLSLLIALYYANLASTNSDIILMAPSFVWAGLFFLVFSIPFYLQLTALAYSLKLPFSLHLDWYLDSLSCSHPRI